MPAPVEALLRDFVRWMGPKPKPYADVIDAWRTSCPRLDVWEEATERGLVERSAVDGRPTVSVTPVGLAMLAGD